jgi:hypothetical protein
VRDSPVSARTSPSPSSRQGAAESTRTGSCRASSCRFDWFLIENDSTGLVPLLDDKNAEEF